jgi:hypothetical protein
MIRAPYIDPTLTPQEFMKIGELLLRWAQLENVVANCLRRMLRLSPEEADIMVFPLTLEQRFHRMDQIAEVNPVSDLVRASLQELKLLLPTIQYVRNSVIHSVVSEDPEDGHKFTLHSKRRTLTKAEIFSSEELTNYTLHVSLALRYALGFDGGRAHVYTLPERPDVPQFLLSVAPGLQTPRKAWPSLQPPPSQA